MVLYSSEKASNFRLGGTEMLTIVDVNGQVKAKLKPLPLCRKLRGYRYLTLIMEEYAPFVGLYNEGGQLLWKYGKMTDCSAIKQF